MIRREMGKLLFILFVLLVTVAAHGGVSMGGRTSEDKARSVFIVGDFNEFRLDRPDIFGLDRFGYGQGRLELSDRIGIEAENRSGILFGGHDHYKGSLEVASGKIGYKNHTVGYQWEPALGAGLKDDFLGMHFFAGARAGISRTNVDQDEFVGSVVSFHAGAWKGTYFQNRYRDRSNLDVYDIVIDNSFNVQKHVEYGNTEYVVGYKREM